jgi:hypothetical protein
VGEVLISIIGSDHPVAQRATPPHLRRGVVKAPLLNQEGRRVRAGGGFPHPAVRVEFRAAKSAGFGNIPAPGSSGKARIPARRTKRIATRDDVSDSLC